MVDITKLDMTNIWADGGDKVDPGAAKVNTGWQVEAVPRQTWNWMQNRVDQNIAYMLQKGIPEWDNVTEYQLNKSYVQRNNVIYKCIQANSNQDPQTATTYWVKAFVESTAFLEAMKGLSVSNNTFAYLGAGGVAAQTPLTAFARSLLDDADAATARTTLAAQLAHVNLTALSSVSGANNTLAYFTGSGTMGSTDFTSFGRSVIAGADAAAVRALLNLGGASLLNVGTAAGTVAAGDDSRITGAAQKASNLSDLQSASAARNNLGLGGSAVLNVGTGAGTVAAGDDVRFTTPLQKASNLSDLANVTTARTNLGLGNVDNTSDVNKPVSTATQALLDGKQPLDATLTALAGLTNAANQLPYFTGVDTLAVTALSAFSRTLLASADAAAWKTTLGAVSQTSAVGAASVPAGATSDRPASPVSGMFRYNNDTGQFEGYQNGSWGDIGGGTAIFSVQWWPGKRSSIPGGMVPADGQTILRSLYPTAFSKISSGDVPTVADSDWLAVNTNRGNFTLGDGATTFRVPDYNGKSSGSRGALFQRGDGLLSGGTIGSIQEDAMQQMTGSFGFRRLNDGTSILAANIGGPFTLAVAGGEAAARATATLGASLSSDVLNYNNSLVARTATENRPLNVTGCWVIKLAGAGINTGTVDVTALAGVVNTLASHDVAAQNLPNNTDLNTIQTNGFYQQQSNVNASLVLNYPIAKAGSMIVTNLSSFTTQQYTTYDTGDVYVRTRYINAWSAWQLLAFDSDVDALNNLVATKAAIPGSTQNFGVSTWTKLAGSAVLPANGTWAWYVIGLNSSAIPTGGNAGVSAGGTTVGTTTNSLGFAWRIA